jgi:hypothetical protein
MIYPENVFIYPENFFGMSGKKILDALFYSESAPQNLAPPTFRSFLRPYHNLKLPAYFAAVSV